jgi:hypothetical protein
MKPPFDQLRSAQVRRYLPGVELKPVGIVLVTMVGSGLFLSQVTAGRRRQADTALQGGEPWSWRWPIGVPICSCARPTVQPDCPSPDWSNSQNRLSR